MSIKNEADNGPQAMTCSDSQQRQLDRSRRLLGPWVVLAAVPVLQESRENKGPLGRVEFRPRKSGKARGPSFEYELLPKRDIQVTGKKK